jgi:hypothetical protein
MLVEVVLYHLSHFACTFLVLGIFEVGSRKLRLASNGDHLDRCLLNSFAFYTYTIYLTILNKWKSTCKKKKILIC